MASIRRTLSPMARPEGQNGNVLHSGPSPLSRSISYSRREPVLVTTFSDFVDSFSVLYRVKSRLLGVFSPSRGVERSKSKRRAGWRKLYIHVFICFIVGVVMGLFSLVSMNKDEAVFPLDVRSSSENASIDTPFDVHLSSENASIDTPFDVRSSENASIGTPLDVSSFSENASIDTPLDVGSSSENASIDTPIEENGGRILSEFELIQNDTVLVPRKLLIIVTTTYTRPFQAYYLNRLSHTLSMVPPPMVWIVVEMSNQTTETAGILRKTGIMYRHLVCGNNISDIKDGSIHQRNVALAHIEKHQLDGIMYFADEDNMYSIELFEQMRDIRRFGKWPVATLTENRAIVEGPVCNGSQISGWHTNERIGRTKRIHASMSGFAFNSTIVWDPKRWHRTTLEPIRQLEKVNEDFQVSAFIEQLVEDESQMECLVDCSKVMVWHLALEASHPLYPHRWHLPLEASHLDEDMLINRTLQTKVAP
ncbi:probable beta-1,4-xylosyltransferase IRX9H [Papaver somniferum]|uniref:probable beta-1,4-xylosyltransferase IRX9H n=1 Tax=Papaver somniferum TaxID=3469 RepID=UPI000E6FC563|nr:probable beta-1,4-xylosyltransferase IRX9H [Papaver somniferum]XP_026439149.1 probable beta-1,4-xylosyltransferase IRX9H [Papaver somniferum]